MRRQGQCREFCSPQDYFSDCFIQTEQVFLPLENLTCVLMTPCNYSYYTERHLTGKQGSFKDAVAASLFY